MTPDPITGNAADLSEETCHVAPQKPDLRTQVAIQGHRLGCALKSIYKQVLREQLEAGAAGNAKRRRQHQRELYDFENYPYLVLLWKETFVRDIDLDETGTARSILPGCCTRRSIARIMMKEDQFSDCELSFDKYQQRAKRLVDAGIAFQLLTEKKAGHRKLLAATELLDRIMQAVGRRIAAEADAAMGKQEGLASGAAVDAATNGQST